MTTDDVVLQFAGAQPLTDGDTLLGRLLTLDPAALVRLQAGRATPGGPAAVAVWAQPLGVLVRRDLTAALDVADRTVAAADLRSRLHGLRVVLPPGADSAWRVSLPPRPGWRPVDDVPVPALRELAERATSLLPGLPDPAGLYDQSVLSVHSPETEVSLPLRVAVVMDRLGFLPGAAADVARVSCTPTWARVVTRLGTAYQRRTAARFGLS